MTPQEAQSEEFSSRAELLRQQLADLDVHYSQMHSNVNEKYH